uniref:ZP domain-containing protein n=1 Tax=Strongyloides venezuelensis TaxID=75913 RepID=A0A0K0G4K2_STRVS
MIFWRVVVFFLLIANIFIYASVPTITLHDGHITLNDYLLKKDYQGTVVPGQPYTIDIYLSQSQHYDYVIESCVYNNKTTFISNNGCIIADKIFVDKWETTDYGYPNSLKRTLIHFIAPEPTLYIHCLLRLIECCSCAEKSCENPNGYNYYPYTPYQLIMSIPKLNISPSVPPSSLGDFNAPAFTSLMPQRLPVEKSDTSIWNQWWIWLIIILAVLLLFCLPCLLAFYFLLKKGQAEKNKDKIITKNKNGDIETNGKNEMHDQIQKNILDNKKNVKTFHTNGHQHIHLPTNLDIYKLERDSLFSHSSDSFVNDEFETTMSQTKSAKIISNPHSTLPFHRLPVDIPENMIHEVKDHLKTTEPIRTTKPYYKESQNFTEQMLKKSTSISSPMQHQQYQDMLRHSNDTIGVSKTHESVFI